MKTKKDSKTSNNSKAIIDTYETIYYVDLVVANKYTTLEELQNLYVYSDKQELDECIIHGDCTTSTVIRKSDNKDCVLVKYNHRTKFKGISDKEDLINTVAHEAGHVVLDIYEHINQNVCNCSPEPFCYLLGWATQCIYKTLTNKHE